VTVTGITTAVAISASGWHTCALLLDGTLRCWGDNSDGQLGDGTTISPPAIHISSTPVTVSGITTGSAIDAGIFHTCALLRDGTAQCWGRNGDGRLGNGSLASSSTPTTVTPTTIPGFVPVALAGGAEHTCALLQDGRVSCWGDNTWGQLGNETPPDPPMCCSTTPARPATGITTAVAISSGVEHTCALLQGGTVSCWGNNNFGRLGVPITDSRTRACANSPSCAFAPVSVNGIFRSAFTLTVTVNDVGSSSRSGTVISSPDGITSCATSCSASFDSLTRVTLTTNPDPKSVFAGWSGCDTVSGTTCTVTMDAARSVTATYDKKPRRSASFSSTGETPLE
jgi:Regulator of Chromosome Condensation (RCC1) repeat protein/List-Bact-rpt repeat protein